MDVYKKTIKNRVIMLTLCTVISIAVVYCGILFADKAETAASTYFDGFSRGFPVGLFSGSCVLMLFFIVRYIKALTNEAFLKKLYITENDERKKLIRQSAMGKSFFFTIGVLVVSVTVASFYNTLVAITLAAVLSIHVLAGVFFKLYYFLKY